MRRILLESLLFLIALALFVSAFPREPRNDIPPDILEVKHYGCSAHDVHTDTVQTTPVETVDAKTGQVRTHYVEGRRVDIVTYRADLDVKYKDGHKWLINEKQPGFDFSDMKRAGDFCVDWNQRVKRAIERARKEEAKKR